MKYEGFFYYPGLMVLTDRHMSMKFHDNKHNNINKYDTSVIAILANHGANQIIIEY